MTHSNLLNAQQTLASLSTVPDEHHVDAMLERELRDFNKKIIVLDDDPTGVQTVHGVSVYTDWTAESIDAGFAEQQSMFFILTNSRGFTAAETKQAHEDIARTVQQTAAKHGKEFIIISRGDSTLRGHYPLETEVLKNTVEAESNRSFDGEVIMPFFQEGGRLTIDNIHYVQEGEQLVPAGETEFAKDRTFGYTESHLGKWAEEKSNGAFKAENAVYLSLEDIRALRIDRLVEQLMTVSDFNKVIVNATQYVDAKVVVIALIRAMNAGKQFMFRSAAALTKIIGGISDKALLTKAELITEPSENGGLIMIGSHVKKTTEQFEVLKTADFIEFIEFDVHLVLHPEQFETEIKRIIDTSERLIRQGQTVAVYTKRERLDLGNNRQEEELMLSVKISDAVTRIVKNLNVRPSFIIAKGGITSSDIGTNGLSVKRATVAGQIQPGIPVWLTGSESKFPGIAYVIFPGNVGSKTSLKDVAEILHG
ncbi:four-carbon acid sugar kinase family protein [Planococcus maritimus]|uniref:four-carbon acid sugar kinase family protein n=1 Tax=Planococcus maritimus TaxID=192421 RepID=UPI000793A683|nr:four-carbon acid sugar kinase family protein [Planococcus maritimus]KYG59378.1 hydroxyacid dehydrogenase [Planococcus maritimus]